MADDGLVAVLVPRDLVMEVYGLIAERSRDPRNIGSQGFGANAPARAQERLEEHWPDELIRRGYAESPPPMKRIIDLLADSPDVVISSDKLAKAIRPDATWPNLAGTLGAFGRRVKSRYKRGRWFFDSRWDHDLGKMVYWMPQSAASALRKESAETTPSAET